jgi:hypothetical protein
MQKVRVETRVRLKAYSILEDAMSMAVDYGWNRAHKHTDTPTEDGLKGEMLKAVMNGLCDILNFEEG